MKSITKELLKFHARLDEQGARLDVGSLPWLCDELEANLKRIQRELNRKDRTSKRKLRAIVADLLSQVNEVRRRVD
jgi:hypothetical protein